MLAAFSAPVLAAGGRGGGYPATAGGTGSATGTGGAGGAGTGGLGGGGGGAGTTGGAGGANSDASGGAGGAGGTAPGGAGSNGADSGSSSAGGGGGGGGAHGAYVNSSTSNSGTLAGGNGGNGGNGTGGSGAGGGGGEGGYGAVVNGSGVTLTSSGTIVGGNGGNGGYNTTWQGGAGGDGGLGAYLTGGATLSNSGSVTGGNGGDGTLSIGLGLQTPNIAGNGGAGVFLAAGTLFNSGSITGGNGGPGIFNALGVPAAAGSGGEGVAGSDATVVNNGSISGGLSGANALSGTHTRANAIAFTGGTNILELWSGSIITGNVVAVSGGSDTLRLGGSTDASFDVSLIGTQYLNFANYGKTGSSTWTLTGTNSAALPWTVSSGALAINATMTGSTVTVNSGGTLSGTGTIGSVSVAGGVFAPGDGTAGSAQTVGTLGFSSGGIYRVFVSPSASSSSTVTGTATLAGASVDAQFSSGSYVASRYTILTANSIVGAFSTLTTMNRPTNLTASLSADATSVSLDLTLAFTAPGGLTGNQQNVADALTNYFNNNGGIPAAFANLSAQQLSQSSGEVGASGPLQASGELTNALLAMLTNGNGGVSGLGGAGPLGSFEPVSQYGPERTWSKEAASAYAALDRAAGIDKATHGPWSVWASGYGGQATVNGNAATGSNDTRTGAWGTAAGASYRLSPDTMLGFALAGGGTNWSVGNGFGGGKGNAVQIAGYARQQFGASYVSGALAYGWHWMSTNRTVTVSGTDVLVADFSAQNLGARIEAGHRFGSARFGITPYAAAQAQAFWLPSYSESATSGSNQFALSYASRRATDARTELGSWFDSSLQPRLKLFGRLAWAHDFRSDASASAVFQALPGSNFTVSGAAAPEDAGLVTAGLKYDLNGRTSLIGKFEGELGSGYRSYAGMGTLKVVLN